MQNSKRKKEEFLRAKKSYDKMMDEIRPFIKKHRTNTYSSPKWEMMN